MSRFPIQETLTAEDYVALLIGRLVMTEAIFDQWLYASITHCQHAKVMRGMINMGAIPIPDSRFAWRIKEWRRLCAELLS